MMNMMSGIYTPDSGSIYRDGKVVSIHSPEDSKKLGIGMVHQHFKLVEAFSAADNIWIGKENNTRKFGDNINNLFLKKNRYNDEKKTLLFTNFEEVSFLEEPAL